jgi:hypothetical protein
MKHIKLLWSFSLLLTVSSINAQDTISFSLREVFDFNVGDEFHIKYTASSVEFIKRLVVDRNEIGTDSVIYLYNDSIYSAKQNPSRIEFNRVEQRYDRIGQLSKIITIPSDTMFENYDGREFVASYWDSTLFFGKDTGIVFTKVITPINPEGYEYVFFFKGLGSYKSVWYGQGGGYENELMYYKKGGQSEGTPIALGLNKLHLEPIELYPNPSSSYIIIDNVSQEFDYAIHSVTSEKVQGGKSSKKIDTSELESGVYYLEIISDDKRLVGKFIKE